MAVAVSIKILVIFKNFALSLKIIKIRIALKYIKLKIEVFPGLKVSYYSSAERTTKVTESVWFSCNCCSLFSPQSKDRKFCII